MAAEAGVDDVVLICALALHRRLTEAELRHAVGDRVYDAFEPQGLLQQHDAEDPDNLIHLGITDHGEDVEINKRAATSDLLVCGTTTMRGRCNRVGPSWTSTGRSCTRRTGVWAG